MYGWSSELSNLHLRTSVWYSGSWIDCPRSVDHFCWAGRGGATEVFHGAGRPSQALTYFRWNCKKTLGQDSNLSKNLLDGVPNFFRKDKRARWFPRSSALKTFLRKVFWLMSTFQRSHSLSESISIERNPQITMVKIYVYLLGTSLWRTWDENMR